MTIDSILNYHPAKFWGEIPSHFSAEYVSANEYNYIHKLTISVIHTFI
jgi:hypothetical protein